MALLEKELNKSLVQEFIQIIEKDKRRKTPVIKFIRSGFVFSIAEHFKNRKGNINFIGITGESASGKSTFVRTLTKKIKEIEKRENK